VLDRNVTSSYIIMGRKQGLDKMLKRIREAKGMTQAELAEKAGVTREYVTMLESGAKKNPSLDLLKRLAKALKVKVAQLVE
jgi:transcriptional regulator with XRE-family HTH domain